MSKLFTPYHLKSLVLRNRTVMAPMCMYSVTKKDGVATDFHKLHYATRAVGGVGLIIVEATGVESRGRISDYDLGIWSDDHIDGLKSIVDECHKYGAKIGIQLGHSGRKSEVLDEELIAPSAIAFDEKYRVPKEMTKEDILAVINSFKEAARRADLAGFDTIEIHGAHGYLISEFLSPISNKRIDEYGGSKENRVRLLREILCEVKSVWPNNKPIIVRVSAEDYLEGGNDSMEMAELLNLVKDEGIDLVDVSTGGVAKAHISVFAGYQSRASYIVRHCTKLPTISGGLIKTYEMAEELLRTERADLVFFGRELLLNPYLPLQMSNGHGVEGLFPPQYMAVKK